MILTVDIEKEMPGSYVARASVGGVEVTAHQIYDRIETAIRQQALNVPEGFANFIQFSYYGMSTGTYAIKEVPPLAAQMADRLVALIAEQHQINQ